MTNYKVTQIWGSFEMPQTTIKKTLTEKELTDLGFFPLEPSEQSDIDKTGKTAICGINKYTIIEKV
ncbi:MAG: hypothetical protein WC365_08135 [Candidatus Babeliales bacterium]|jgi:hypothetical protein